MLVVELDGHSHDLRRAHDAARERFMAEAGYKVLRFTVADVQGNVEGADAHGFKFGLCRMYTNDKDFQPKLH